MQNRSRSRCMLYKPLYAFKMVHYDWDKIMRSLYFIFVFFFFSTSTYDSNHALRPSLIPRSAIFGTGAVSWELPIYTRHVLDNARTKCCRRWVDYTNTRKVLAGTARAGRNREEGREETWRGGLREIGKGWGKSAILKGWDGGERWLGEKAPHGRVFNRTREAVKAIAMRPRRGVESEHHLVNSRVLFPSASAPIGLRDHSGRSSSSSYFIRSYLLRLERCSLDSPSACDRREYTSCTGEVSVPLHMSLRDESTGRWGPIYFTRPHPRLLLTSQQTFMAFQRVW